LSDLISRAEKSSTQSGDGNTIETVECRKAKTAQWDNRMTVAYQQAVRARELEKGRPSGLSGAIWPVLGRRPD
jgi:uncharacterized protein YecT (DUF1311 family)